MSLDTLYKLAEDINVSWTSREAVDWSEAEQIVRLLKELSEHELSCMPKLMDIITYASSQKDWSSDYVASWPDIIIRDVQDYLQSISDMASPGHSFFTE